MNWSESTVTRLADRTRKKLPTDGSEMAERIKAPVEHSCGHTSPRELRERDKQGGTTRALYSTDPVRVHRATERAIWFWSTRVCPDCYLEKIAEDLPAEGEPKWTWCRLDDERTWGIRMEVPTSETHEHRPEPGQRVAVLKMDGTYSRTVVDQVVKSITGPVTSSLICSVIKKQKTPRGEGTPAGQGDGE